MKKWLYDRPWIWVVVLLTLLVGGGIYVVALAEMNKPTIVKEKPVKVSLERLENHPALDYKMSLNQLT